MRPQVRFVEWTRHLTPALVLAAAASSAAVACVQAQEAVQVASPDGRNVVTVATRGDSLFYSVERDGRKVILPSRLGFEFRNATPLSVGLTITGTATKIS